MATSLRQKIVKTQRWINLCAETKVDQQVISSEFVKVISNYC